MSRNNAVATSLFALLVFAAGCGEGGVDWNAPENILLREKTQEKEGGMELEYWSLIDSPCKPIYDALADVEHYPEFMPGLDRANLLSVKDNKKTLQVAQRVISRQSNAKVEWTFHPDKPALEFKTINSDFAYNDGRHEFESSPDGKRCLLRSTFLVKPAPGAAEMPLGTLVQGTRESFQAAALAVKARATGKK